MLGNHQTNVILAGEIREADRATEFKQRCNGLGSKGITLHPGCTLMVIDNCGWLRQKQGEPERVKQGGCPPCLRRWQ
ncbi:MAG: hypothetical protein ABSH38_17865 [Verrucomicrobiota bacterium]